MCELQQHCCGAVVIFLCTMLVLLFKGSLCDCDKWSSFATGVCKWSWLFIQVKLNNFFQYSTTIASSNKAHILANELNHISPWDSKRKLTLSSLYTLNHFSTCTWSILFSPSLEVTEWKIISSSVCLYPSFSSQLCTAWLDRCWYNSMIGVT